MEICLNCQFIALILKGLQAGGGGGRECGGVLEIISLIGMSEFPVIKLRSANLHLLNIQNNLGFNQVISEAELRVMRGQMRLLVVAVAKSPKAVMSSIALEVISYIERNILHCR